MLCRIPLWVRDQERLQGRRHPRPAGGPSGAVVGRPLTSEASRSQASEIRDTGAGYAAVSSNDALTKASGVFLDKALHPEIG